MVISCSSSSMLKSSMLRIGFSRDIHKLVEGRDLLLGGVKIPYHLGELAHSDGDVLYHALAESILGALALGDLGKHFPDTSDETLNMDSSIIVRKCYGFAKERGYHIVNVDISITLERPKLKDYIQQIRENIAKNLETDIDNVSVKAGTNEGCGEIGRNEAVSAESIILLEK